MNEWSSGEYFKLNVIEEVSPTKWKILLKLIKNILPQKVGEMLKVGLRKTLLQLARRMPRDY
jgi:hypothetical protein